MKNFPKPDKESHKFSVLLLEPWLHFLSPPAVRSLSIFATVSTVGAAPAGTKADQCGGAGFESVMPSNVTQSWQGSFKHHLVPLVRKESQGVHLEVRKAASHGPTQGKKA